MEENNKVGAWIGAIITLIYLVSPLDIVPGCRTICRTAG